MMGLFNKFRTSVLGVDKSSKAPTFPRKWKVLLGCLAAACIFVWNNWRATTSVSSLSAIQIKSAIPTSLMEILVGGSILAKELNPADLFIEDPYLTKDLANPWVQSSLNKQDPVKTGFVIAVSSVVQNRLSHVGGTGHWYHLLQTVLPSIKEAHDAIWGNETKTKVLSQDPSAYDDVYIVFNEQESVDNLNSFTRFSLAMVLTGGQFKRIHFAHADKCIVSSETAAALKGLHVHFTADFEKQSLSEIFVKSSVDHVQRTDKITQLRQEGVMEGNVKPLEEHDTVQFRHFHKIQLMAPRRQYQWFLTPDKKVLFKKAYSQLCHLPPTAPAMMDIAHAYQPSTESQDLSYAKARMPVVNTNDELTLLPNDDINVVAHTADQELILDSSPTNPFRAGLTLSKAIVSKTYGPPAPVPSNAVSATGAITSTVTTNHVRNIMVYQRDNTRKFLNEDELVKTLKEELKKTTYSSIPHAVSSSSSGPKKNEATPVTASSVVPASTGTSLSSVTWNVQLVVHDQQRSPCDLVNMMQSTTALLTTHGFQSTMLLFLPDESVLAEVHTNSAFFPHHFGQLQLAFRQRFGDKRSYLAEESVATSWLGKILEVVFGSSCENVKTCRSLAKRQDAIATPAFLSRFAKFLNTHFVVVNSS